MALTLKRKASELPEVTDLPSTKKQAIKKTDHFRFLDLPAELRNIIYEMSMEDVSDQVISRDGPIGFKFPAVQTLGLRRLHGVPYTPNKLKMPPFLGFTQTCRQIRSEFRPTYISRPKVHVRDIQLYLHIFIQRPKLHWKKALQVDKLHSITILASLCTDVDLISLLRLKALHPSISIDVEAAKPKYQDSVKPFEKIFNNENDLWLHWIKTGAMTQARLEISYPYRQHRQPVGSAAHVCLHVVRRRDAYIPYEVNEMFLDWPAIYVTEGIAG